MNQLHDLNESALIDQLEGFMRKWTQEEIFDLFPEMEFKKIPSKTDEQFQKLRLSFMGRKTYIGAIGYQLFNKEYLHELKEILKDILKDSYFIELEAGLGTWTLLLNQMGFPGYGITLEIPEEDAKYHWGLDSKSKFYLEAIKKKLLKFSRLEDIQLKAHGVPEIVLVSWIPYKGGYEVIQFMENLDYLPKYFLIVGESRGGCTASDAFFDWLDKNYTEEYQFKQYQPFEAIYDRPILYRRKDGEHRRSKMERCR